MAIIRESEERKKTGQQLEWKNAVRSDDGRSQGGNGAAERADGAVDGRLSVETLALVALLAAVRARGRVPALGRVERRVQRHLHVAVERHGRVEDAAGRQTVEGHCSLHRQSRYIVSFDGRQHERDYLRFFVHVEAEPVPVEIEEHADGGAGVDAAVRPVAVHVGVQKPRALVIDVHGPAELVFACERREKNK